MQGSANGWRHKVVPVSHGPCDARTQPAALVYPRAPVKGLASHHRTGWRAVPCGVERLLHSPGSGLLYIGGVAYASSGCPNLNYALVVPACNRLAIVAASSVTRSGLLT